MEWGYAYIKCYKKEEADRSSFVNYACAPRARQGVFDVYSLGSKRLLEVRTGCRDNDGWICLSWVLLAIWVELVYYRFNFISKYYTK